MSLQNLSKHLKKKTLDTHFFASLLKCPFFPFKFNRDRGYAENIQRPFGVKYNPYTQTVDVLSNAKRITAAVSELRGDLSIVSSALRKVSALDQDLDVEKITQMLQAGIQVGDRSPVSPDSDGSQEGSDKNAQPKDEPIASE